MQKAADRPAKPAQEAPNAKGRPPPRGPAAFLLRENAGGARKRKGDPLGSPLPGALLAHPRPLPAQRAPGAGGALVSHRVAPAVPSALAGLTSGFGCAPAARAAGPRGALRRGLPRGGSALRAPWGPHSARGRCPLRTVGGGGAYCVSRRARPISGARLRRSRALHLRPINQVVCSRLDAFSGYPRRTRLPSGAVRSTAGTPEVRPSRSSRTGDGPPQPSCARGG